MRDYGKVAPQFWTGKTGKELKAQGHEAVIVAFYLMTSPHANMLGLYYLPKLYIAHETGLGMEGACKGLARAIEAGFCSYDEASEHVFVHAMARFQIGDALKADDKRCKGIENELSKVPESELRQRFRDIYTEAFNLSKTHAPRKGLGRPSEAKNKNKSRNKSKSKGAPSPLPEDFSVSERVKTWASEKGHTRLSEHLESFKAKCLAKGYKYVDWDSAFMEAIRGDWAKLNGSGYGGKRSAESEVDDIFRRVDR